MSEPTTLPTLIQTGQTFPDLETITTLFNNDTASNITHITEDPMIGMASSPEVYAVLLGVSLIAVIVIILLIMIVVLRFMAHQKGTYYTQEETLAFKSDPEMQVITEDMEDQEDLEDQKDPEEEEP